MRTRSINNRNPSLWVQCAFIYAGITGFTKQAFEKASLLFDRKDIPSSLNGRSYMVTGANSGIGKACAKALLSRGGLVHMACRNRERALAAQEELLKETGAPESNCRVHILDMSSVKQIKAFARSFNDGGMRLDGLINNAGCMLHKYDKTEEGNEINFATNTLGTFVLTEELLPSLQRIDDVVVEEEKGKVSKDHYDNDVFGSSPPPSRVITVSSGGAYTQKLDYQNVNTLENDNQSLCINHHFSAAYSSFLKRGFNDGTYIYAQNKRQQIALSQKWSRMMRKQMMVNKEGKKNKKKEKKKKVAKYLESTESSLSRTARRNVVFQSMHPGWADTPALRHGMPDFHRRFNNYLRSPEQGADTAIWYYYYYYYYYYYKEQP